MADRKNERPSQQKMETWKLGIEEELNERGGVRKQVATWMITGSMMMITMKNQDGGSL